MGGWVDRWAGGSIDGRERVNRWAGGSIVGREQVNKWAGIGQ